jgi:Spy/CpxP family protein refolding chaperone
MELRATLRIIRGKKAAIREPKEKTEMQRRGFLAIAGMLAAALALPAQQTVAASASASQKPAATQSPSVDEHMNMLSQRLDLTQKQQVKIKPIVKEMIDSTSKVNNDQSLTPEQRQAEMKEAMAKADREARKFLTDDQKTKLDQLENEMHPHSEMH